MATPHAWKTFYQRLAYLYYAVAKADEKVVAEEIAKVHEVVKKDWLSVEHTEDEFGTDAAYQIDIAFDWLVEQGPSSEKAFEKFEHFVTEHPDFFNAKLKKRILRTASAVASSFHGINKPEESILNKLENLLG